MSRLESHAPAKINLALRVLRRRLDGAHDLTSLVAFAEIGDKLVLDPGSRLHLVVQGPMADRCGPIADNLVLKAVRALSARIERLIHGTFTLEKHLPVGAGFGGGSADAAAALRLIAEANALDPTDMRLFEAARAVGADVPVCLESKPRVMSGIGDVLSSPIQLPKLAAVLVFPGVPVATAAAFRAFELVPGRRSTPYAEEEIPKRREALIAFLEQETNDLSRAARSIAPVVAAAEEALDETSPRLVRISGSGSGAFALYDEADEAKEAAESVRNEHPTWWVTSTTIG